MRFSKSTLIMFGLAAIFAPVGLTAQAVRADTIAYQSTGTVFYRSLSDAPVIIDPSIQFQGVNDGTFSYPNPNSPFILGQFEISPLADGIIRTYVNAPFEINVRFTPPNLSSGNDNEATIIGRLNGTLGGQNDTLLNASIEIVRPTKIPSSLTPTPYSGLPFPLESLQPNMPLVWTLNPNGPTTIELLGTIHATPEPSSIAFMMAIIAFVGVVRVRKGKRN